MRCRVDPNSLVPPSLQIVAWVLDAVAGGALPAGAKLPSVRAMAAQALVNPNTVTKAYRDLEHLGATQGRNGSGVFVTEDGAGIAHRVRSAATLDALRGAAAQALRAGHSAATLMRVLEDAAATKVGIGAGTRKGNQG